MSRVHGWLSGWTATAVGTLLLLAALGAWALASPVGASPDEDYHLTSIWCGLGLRDGVCEVGDDSGARSAPHALRASNCYAFEPTTSASCQPQGLRGDIEVLKSTERGNFRGDYPPVFYAFNALFVGPNVSVSVLVMRVVNGLLFLAVAGMTYAASAPGLRRALLTAAVVTSVPLSIFLIPSVNPSSWAITSALTLLVAVLGYLTATGRRRAVLGMLAGLSLLLGAGARADSAMYAEVAIGAALLLAFRPTLVYLRRAIYPLLLAVAAGMLFLASGQSSAVSAPVPQPLGPGLVVELLSDVPELWIGSLGYWGLGWLDTSMPPVVWVVCWGVLAGVVFTASARFDRRSASATLAVLAAAWLVPAYIQYLSGAPVGAYVQPRYVLPLLMLLVVCVLVRLDGPAFEITSAQRWTVVVALTLANTAALHTNLRRYLTGIDIPGINLNRDAEWWWGGPGSPMAVWLIGSIAFAGALVLLTRELTIPAPAVIRPVARRDADAAVTPASGPVPAPSPDGASERPALTVPVAARPTLLADAPPS